MRWIVGPLFICLALVWIVGCGVKGDPLPPERPSELGRGKPAYNRGSTGIIYPELPPINRESLEEEEENVPE
ncbi:MAG: hypothetical protein KDD35_00425 [Bdellovibrionales bacterium]|nr:hypothetical protein [Bdellovibrionales bacterium]